MTPRPGDLIQITAAAGPAVHPMTARVVRVNNWPTYDGWAWLEVREIYSDRAASAVRMAYVNTAGVNVLRSAETHDQTRARLLAAAGNAGHYAQVPAQRVPADHFGRSR